MDSASQSESTRELLDDVTRLSRQGWRRASPAWFALLLVSTTVLAAVPVTLLLGTDGGPYWLVAGPTSAVLAGWFFATRRAQPPQRVGLVVLGTGCALLLVAVGLAWWGGGGWAAALPWLAVGAGFGVFAAAWRSAPTAVFAGVTVLGSLAVGVAAPEQGDLVLVLVVGLTAAAAALVDLVRADGPA